LALRSRGRFSGCGCGVPVPEHGVQKQIGIGELLPNREHRSTGRELHAVDEEPVRRSMKDAERGREEGEVPHGPPWEQFVEDILKSHEITFIDLLEGILLLIGWNFCLCALVDRDARGEGREKGESSWIVRRRGGSKGWGWGGDRVCGGREKFLLGERGGGEVSLGFRETDASRDRHPLLLPRRWGAAIATLGQLSEDSFVCGSVERHGALENRTAILNQAKRNCTREERGGEELWEDGLMEGRVHCGGGEKEES
jgi:hypothetical protein